LDLPETEKWGRKNLDLLHLTVMYSINHYIYLTLTNIQRHNPRGTTNKQTNAIMGETVIKKMYNQQKNKSNTFLNIQAEK
jgi:hypothetical protein